MIIALAIRGLVATTAWPLLILEVVSSMDVSISVQNSHVKIGIR